MKQGAKRFFALSLALLMVSAMFVIPALAASFGDVKEDAYYAPAVKWAVSNGVTDGFSDGTFRPDATCTRGQVVTFIWRANGKPEPKTTANPFSDVDPASPFYKAILWACEKGITNGTSPTTFNPSGTCTRGQIVTFIWRANGQPSASGNSALAAGYDSGAYYKNAVAWADNLGLLGGTGTAFKPGDACPRADVVTYLYRNDKPFEFSGTPVEALLTGVEIAKTGNKENALLYLEWAAAHGDSGVLSDVATHYLDSSLGLLEYEKAREYFERLANEGNGYAFMMLGQIYMNGGGVPQNLEKAREYLEKAAASDHDWSAGHALYYLGQMYEQRNDIPKALEYYKQSAEKGYPEQAAAKVAELQAKLNG